MVGESVLGCLAFDVESVQEIPNGMPLICALAPYCYVAQPTDVPRLLSVTDLIM